MRNNSESIPQLQDGSISDWVYVRPISNSKYRDIILHALGQVIVAYSVPSDLDAFGISANSSSSNQVEQTLGPEPGTVIQVLADVQLTHEPLDGDQDIKIQHPLFLSFLLDRLYPQGLFVGPNDAGHTVRVAPSRQFFDFEGA